MWIRADGHGAGLAALPGLGPVGAQLLRPDSAPARPGLGTGHAVPQQPRVLPGLLSGR